MPTGKTRPLLLPLLAGAVVALVISLSTPGFAASDPSGAAVPSPARIKAPPAGGAPAGVLPATSADSRPRSHPLPWLAVAAVLLLIPAMLRWDSAGWKNPTHPTHSRFAEFAIDNLRMRFPEVLKFQKQIVEGANQELHELTVQGTKYGLDLDVKRAEHLGTNEGCNDMEGWWRDCLEAYRAGEKERAYFILGIMLHMIADMGVPAHANRIHHQGNATEFDNFEAMGTFNWKPRFQINRADPDYIEPWKYYKFSESWTKADAPGYSNRSTFSKTWALAKQWERDLLSDRQGRTCFVTMWTVQSAARAFAAEQPEPPPAPLATAAPSASPSAGAYNGVTYTVVKGDNLTFIARKFGVRSWLDLYNHADNAAFRAKRPNPDLIFPGDVVKIPAALQKTGAR